MSYESPIGVYKTEPMIEQLRDKMDNLIFQAVQKVDVQVDRAELIKALEYDRGQYEKGFHDGRLYVPPCPANADRLRAMSDEELAEWLEAHDFTVHGMLAKKKLILDWLKSPGEEGDK